MLYSVLYGHLDKVNVKIGDYVTYNKKIGTAGNTGKASTGRHMHIGVVNGIMTKLWRLADMASNKPVPNKKETEYFITDDFWIKGKSVITTQWLGYRNHYAYDIVVENRKDWDFVWNRSYVGIVTEIGYDEVGYGNYVIITYSTNQKAVDIISGQDVSDLEDKILKLENELKTTKEKIIKLENNAVEAIAILNKR